MRLSWREQISQNPHLQDIKNWPSIDIGTLPRSHRKPYLTNRKIVAKVLSGVSAKDVANEYGVSKNKISRLLSRCLSGNDVNGPALTDGLIPHKRLSEHMRRSKLATLLAPIGNQNSFKYLLDNVPGLRLNLDAMMLNRIKDKPTAQVVTPYSVFGEFKRVLKEANWPGDQYPYTTAKCGYESVRRYFHLRLNELRAEHLNKKAILKESIKRVINPLQSIEIDEQLVDINTTIHIEVGDVLIPLRISRASLLLAIDTTTTCALAYHLSLSRSPDQDDVLQLFANITRAWEPLDLETPGLSYFPGSGFPSMWGDEYSHLTFEEVKLDNALIHLANAVRTEICYKHSATLHLGLPKSPKTRNFVEAAFRSINRAVHRFPSTKGSHPMDSKRESSKNLKSPPKITLKNFEETLSVVISKHNATIRSELFGLTPLEAIRRHASNHYMRWRLDNYDQSWSPFEGEKRCRVIFLKDEKRRAFINFMYLRYTGDCLNDSRLINNYVLVRYDRRDIRSADIFSLDGRFLGKIFAPKSWQRFAHGLRTRRIVIQLTREFKFKNDDLLAEYFHHLMINRDTPEKALELIRVSRESDRIVPSKTPHKRIDSDNTVLDGLDCPATNSDKIDHFMRDGRTRKVRKDTVDRATWKSSWATKWEGDNNEE